MDPTDFDAELAQLLESEQQEQLTNERKFQSFYVVPIEMEREYLVEYFQNQVVDLYAPDDKDEITLESFFEKPSIEEEEDHIEELQARILEKIETIQGIREGEMRIFGEGIYMYDPSNFPDPSVEVNVDPQIIPVPDPTIYTSTDMEARSYTPRVAEELNEGEYIYGHIDRYWVAPVVTDESLDDAEINESLGIWVHLKDAALKDDSGMELRAFPELDVPFSGDGLAFTIIMRKGSEQGSEEIPRIEAKDDRPNIKELLRGFTTQELFALIESDLNHNEYSNPELHAARAEYMTELVLAMDIITADEQFILTAENTINGEGRENPLIDQTVVYVQPTIIDVSNTWRVVHGFMVIDDDGSVRDIVHVLPEDIKTIDYEK